MQKKVVIIIAVIGTIVLGGGLWWFGRSSEKANLISPKVPPTDNEPSKAPSLKTLKWEDPAGFIFEYPEGVKINNHPEDKVNYANLEMTYPGKEGKIFVLAQDTALKRISDWEKTQTQSSAVTLGGKEAKKISVNAGITIIGTIDDGILFTIKEVQETDPTFWQKAFDQIISSFKFWQPTPAESSTPASGGGGEIIEEEEIIE